MALFALVEPGVAAPTQFRALQPVEHEQRAFDAPKLLERQIELVLPAVGRELPQLDGMDGPQTEVPMQDRGLLRNDSKRELSAMSTTIIGLDLAKNVFQVHGVDAKGKTVLRKRLRRSELAPFFAALTPCVIGIEACGSGHHWARELQRFGHQVRPMPS